MNKIEATGQEKCTFCTPELHCVGGTNEYSDLVINLSGTQLEVSEGEYPWILDKFPIRFCPMCGQALSDEEKAQDIGKEAD